MQCVYVLDELSSDHFYCDFSFHLVPYLFALYTPPTRLVALGWASIDFILVRLQPRKSFIQMAFGGRRMLLRRSVHLWALTIGHTSCHCHQHPYQPVVHILRISSAKAFILLSIPNSGFYSSILWIFPIFPIHFHFSLCLVYCYEIYFCFL